MLQHKFEKQPRTIARRKKGNDSRWWLRINCKWKKRNTTDVFAWQSAPTARVTRRRKKKREKKKLTRFSCPSFNLRRTNARDFYDFAINPSPLIKTCANARRRWFRRSVCNFARETSWNVLREDGKVHKSESSVSTVHVSREVIRENPETRGPVHTTGEKFWYTC